MVDKSTADNGGLTETLSAIRRRAWSPPAEQLSWEWIRDHVTEIPYSPVPGGFNPDLVPAVKPIMEAIADPRYQLVVLCCAVQTVKTISIEASIVWSVANDPGPTMLILPQAAEARDEMSMRLRPLMDNTPMVKPLIPVGVNRDMANKTSILFNNGMSLWVLGSHPRNLERRSLRRVFIDECWQLERDRIGEAMARTTAFGVFGKVVLASQGSEPDHDFARLWETTNMQVWTFVCPECGHRQPFELEGLTFPSEKDEAGDYDFKAVVAGTQYKCAGCAYLFDDAPETRRDLNDPDKGAKFVAANPNASGGKVGFRITAISTMPWGQLAEEYLRAKVASWTGNFGPLKMFHMKRLANFFGDAIDEDFALELGGGGYNAEDWRDWQDDPDEWTEGLVRMAGGLVKVSPGTKERRDAKDSKGNPLYTRLRMFAVDVQRDHFWGVVRTFGADGSSRLIWAGKILSWQEIEIMRVNYEVNRSLVFIDCGDQPFADVYPMAGSAGYCCLRGDQRLTFAHRSVLKKGATTQKYYSPVRWVNLGTGRKKKVRVHHFSALNMRDILHRQMKTPELWQLPDDLAKMCPVYEEQISSQRRLKNKNGKWVWKTVNEKAGEHLADCEVMCLVGGCMVGLVGGDIETVDEVE
jgi:hypothetical protein